MRWNRFLLAITSWLVVGTAPMPARKGQVFQAAIGFLVVSSVPAYAPPVIAAAVAAVSSLTWAAVGAFLLKAAVVIGLSLIAQALKPSPKAPDQPTFGLNTTLQSGGVVPRSFLIGTYATAGSEFYPARTWGKVDKTPNAYFSRFIALSDLPMTALTGMIVDGQAVTYGSGSPDANLGYAIPEYNKDSKDHLWVKFHDGTQTAADSWAISQFGGDPDYPYGSDQVGRGVAYVIVTALIEPTLFPSFPNYILVGQGAKFYDPRKDTTVGGSGSQRFSDSSTWAFTENPAVIKYNVLRGISWSGQWLFGLQGTASGRLPLASWFAAMNVCDNTVSYKPATPVPQFRCGGEVNVGSEPASFLDELNKADNGRIAEAGGIFKTRSGPVGSAVMSFSDKDLIVTEAQNFDPFPGLEDTINGVAARYPEPVQSWAMTDAPALYDATLEAADGNRRLIASMDYNFVPFGDQVQFLMKSARDEARKFRGHVVVAPPSAWSLEALDVIAWTSVANGYSSKLFTVLPTDQGNLDQALILKEVDPADYDWDPSTDYRAYTPIPITGQPIPAQVMTGFAVAGIELTGGDGRKVAAINIQWGTAGIDDVTGIQYEVRLASDSSYVTAGETDSFANGHLYASLNILGATNYEVRARYRPSTSVRTADWSDWLPVTTPDVKIVSEQLEDALITFGKFAAGIIPVQQVDDLADAIVGENNMAVLTTDGKVYKDVDGTGNWQPLVSGADLADYSILGTKLAIADVTNICTNPDFVDGAGAPNAAGWSNGSGALTVHDNGTGFAAAGWPSRYSGNMNTRDNYFGQYMPCAASQTFYVEGYVSDQSAHGGTLGMLFLDASKSPINWLGVAFAASTGSSTPARVSGQFTAPAGTKYAQIWVQQAATSGFGNLYVNHLIYRKAASAELLVDGSITANKVGANEITAGKLAVGAINATNILADNIIVTGKLVVNSVTDTIASSTGSQSMGTFPTPAAVLGGSGSITFAAANQPVFFVITASASTAGRQRSVSFDLYRNGNHIFGAGSVPLTGTFAASFTGFDASNTTGSNTYEFYISEDDPTGSGVPGTCNSATLFVAYWKR